jgi:hypothetical protein
MEKIHTPGSQGNIFALNFSTNGVSYCQIRCKLRVSSPPICQFYIFTNFPWEGGMCLLTVVDGWHVWFAVENRILTGNADFSSVVLPWLSMEERKSSVYCVHLSFVCNVILNNCILIILWKDDCEFWQNVSSVYEADWEVTASLLSR